LAPLQSVTQTCRKNEFLTTSFSLLPRFLPLQRSFPWRATLTRGFPTPTLRYALRVSRPLDVLLPPRPAGFIPFQLRSWGSPFEVFLPPKQPYILPDAPTFMKLVDGNYTKDPSSRFFSALEIPIKSPGISRFPLLDTPLGLHPLRFLTLHVVAFGNIPSRT
jgi:hypothetical protein